MARHLAIGDIHGCFETLKRLLRVVEPREEDLIITLGDYINRGPNSYGVMEWLIQTQKTGQLRALRGNHDVMFAQAIEGENISRFRKVGGDETLKSYAKYGNRSGKLNDVPEHHFQFLESELLPYYEMDTHFFVHANAYADYPLADQPDYMLYWEKFNYPPRHMSGKIMVCGHSSQKSGRPLVTEDAICIDTFAHGGGWLSCLDVQADMLWQANRDGDVRQLPLSEIEQLDIR